MSSKVTMIRETGMELNQKLTSKARKAARFFKPKQQTDSVEIAEKSVKKLNKKSIITAALAVFGAVVLTAGSIFLFKNKSADPLKQSEQMLKKIKKYSAKQQKSTQKICNQFDELQKFVLEQSKK